MDSKINYTEALSNFEKICDEVISTGQPKEIERKDGESITLIPTRELDSLRETVYLFGSHENATRLLDALQRAKAGTNQPQSLESLYQELGLDKEETISALI